MDTITKTRDPMPYEVKLVVLIDNIQYHSFIEEPRVTWILDSLEKRFQIAEPRRSDRLWHMSLRQSVAKRLRQMETSKAFFDDAGGACCLWLGLRHYEGGEQLRKGLEATISKGAVLTISIGNSPGSAPDTAWSFMIGHDIHDGREALARHRPDQVRIFANEPQS